MKRKTILLALDGSSQSLYAAELAWRLAKLMRARLVVQTVVDSAALWQVMGQSTAGFIGSGPYLELHEAAVTGLRKAAEVLQMSYGSRVQSQSIETEYFIDEGDAVREIVERARHCDLVIAGHRYHQRDDRPDEMSQRRFVSLSLTEQLAQRCPVPLIVVNDRCKPWSASRLILSDETFDPAVIDDFIEFTSMIGATREIVCVGGAIGLDTLIEKVRDQVPRCVRARLAARVLTNAEDVGEFVIDTPATMLPVMAARETPRTTKSEDSGDADDGRPVRQSCEGGKPSRFLHYSSVPCVMFLPPRCVVEKTERQVESTHA